MPQEFHVVRCYACLVFQVQQVKKAHKWACKMCGEKQSLKKEYGRGSGADCRRHVQKLNMIAGGSGGTGCTPDPSPEQCQAIANSSFDADFRDVTENRQDSLENTEVEAPLSKWQAFIDEDGTDEIPEGPTQEDHSHPRLGSAEITLSRPAYRGRGGRRHGGWKSARKRKRDDPDQDIDAESGTASLQNANFSCLGFRQTWPTSASGFKTTRLQDQGNIFRDVANA
ncbi:MRN complex-interacting protein-like isoform X2 [Acanthaster planci]|nr:MRN complex-interacting protein-like isoform X2 [Acanthaster planci]XP_022083433.1 MRN complex-interacting protein-like isoform X2 [Acanthaster planci]